MFEIRVICDPDDTDRVTAALADTFALNAVRDYSTHDGKQRRLYITAGHRALSNDLIEHRRAQSHPAYTGAPGLHEETEWLISQANTGRSDREWWLRRAALDDRFHPGEQADYVARALIALDGADVTDNPRDYVREQYGKWREQSALWRDLEGRHL
ncbi:hypothetical protein [Streptomyces acidiscabies]|uniref:hypothetical protein n=1 Tax=Streptomyces acidiscabies TaxID=42234 RepID=UPI00073F756F|nr:hypothetical protein [Streptomyces acidiscabies]GAQ58742.1 hypothetical protein a10_08638 [Streptomyces acidiscabies]